METIREIYDYLKDKLKSPFIVERHVELILISNISIPEDNNDIAIIKKDKHNFKVEYIESKCDKEKIEMFEIILRLLRETNTKIKYNQKQITQVKELIKLENNNNYVNTEQHWGKCSFANNYFYEIFDPKNEVYKRGILIYHNNILIGVIKTKKNPTMLSFKLNENDVPLEKLTIYDIPNDLIKQINKIILNPSKMRKFKTKFKRDWYRINLIGQLPINITNQRKLLDPKEIRPAHLRLEEIEGNEEYEYVVKKENEKTKLGIVRTMIERIAKTYKQNKNKNKFDGTIDLVNITTDAD